MESYFLGVDNLISNSKTNYFINKENLVLGFYIEDCNGYASAVIIYIADPLGNKHDVIKSYSPIVINYVLDSFLKDLGL